MTAWKNILCPVDFSDASREAMHAAADLAAALGAELSLLSVYEMPTYALPDGVILGGPVGLEELRDTVEESLRKWQAEAEQRVGRDVLALTAMGTPDREIVAAARAGAHDVIVMGTHGRTGLDHLLLGSVAEKVLRRAPCPVLTIRPQPSSTSAT